MGAAMTGLRCRHGRCDRLPKQDGMCAKHVKAARAARLAGRVPVTDGARHRVLAWRAQGHTWVAIGDATGVAWQTIRDVTLLRWCHVRTEAAILAVTEIAPRSDSAVRVPSLGLQRRVRALQTRGHSIRAIAAGAAVSTPAITNAMRRRYTSMATHVAVAALFETWQHVDGGSQRTRTFARRRDYPGPVAWDDDGSIDDPRVRASRRPTHRTLAKLDAIEQAEIEQLRQLRRGA